MVKKVILAGSYSEVENLSLQVLSTVAKEEGFDRRIVLIRNGDFSELEAVLKDFEPKFVGFNVYTGNHVPIFDFLDKIRKNSPNLKTIVGGPHPTYYIKESTEHADYVVPSIGHESFRRILRGDADEGVVHLKEIGKWPMPDRELFFKEFPLHKLSKIKSVVASLGCPYKCGHCYNSRLFEKISPALTESQRQEMGRAIGKSGRLFPTLKRGVDEVLEEIALLKAISPETKMIFFQDDIFGADLDWLREFARKYPSNGFPFHAQMRFEYANPNTKDGRERIKLLKQSGCTGLTFAIESGNYIIREEILRRKTTEDLIFETLDYINSYGFRIRTQQMLGLPYGSTSIQTPINLEADLETLELNVNISQLIKTKKLMAWAAIYTPYLGTFTGDYCVEHGYYGGNNQEIKPTFFDRSVLNFPKKWVGPSLSHDSSDVWMGKEEQEIYKTRMQYLRDLFSFFALMPEGHILARDFLEKEGISSDAEKFSRLGNETRLNLYNAFLYKTE